MLKPKSITGIVRGCGKRKPGGLYVCSGSSPLGRPLEEFVIDPPLPYDGEHFRAPLVIEKEGKKHLLLWVGSEYYPYCSDYLEETKQFGASKRIPSTFPIERLEPGSMIFLIHPKAIIEDHFFLPTVDYCPGKNEEHLASNDQFCLGHSYQIAEPNNGPLKRKLGSTEYAIFPHSASKVECDFRPGIFLRLPITHFDHILHEGTANPKITGKETKLPLNLEEQ
jgi:hypothetical protein